MFQVDFEKQQIRIEKKELTKTFFLKFSLKCSPNSFIVLQHDPSKTTFGSSSGVKVSRDLEISMVKVDIVKGQSIPKLDQNRHLSCRTIELTATQFDIMYAIVAFDGLKRPDPLRDTLYVSMRALEIFDNFDSERSRGKSEYCSI
jgi:hypothetical protein